MTGRTRSAGGGLAVLIVGFTLLVPGGALARPAGSLDPSYGPDGAGVVKRDDLNPAFDGAFLTPDQGAVIPVSSYPGFESGIVALDPAGAPVAGFGTNGFTPYEPQSGPGVVEQRQADGRIVRGDDDDATRIVVQRHEPDGSLDTSYGEGGIGTSAPFPGDDTYLNVREMTIDDDGRAIVVARISARDGDPTDHIGVARFEADGDPDPTFGGDGLVELRLEVDSKQAASDASAVMAQPDGKVVVGGHYSFPHPNYDGQHHLLVRYTEDGEPDPTFGDEGIVLGGSVARASITDLALYPDGRIAATANNASEPDDGFTALRFESDGVLDPSFGQDGIAEVAFDPNGGGSANSVVLAGDTVLVGGSARPYGEMHNGWVIARLTDAGSLDEAFGDGGIAYQDFGNRSHHAVLRDLDVLPGARTVLASGGVPNRFGDVSVLGVARFLLEGSPPVATAAPVVEGTPRDGETLVAGRGEWQDADEEGFTYRWERCAGADTDPTVDPEPAGCEVIAGENAGTLQLAPADAGKHVRVAVTATNESGTTRQASATAGPVAERAPENAARPAIAPAGDVRPGQELTVDTPGTWSGTPPLTFSYQWERCDGNGEQCAAVEGATSDAYVALDDQVGSRLRVRVTATNGGGSASEVSGTRLVVATPVDATAPSATTPPVVEPDGAVVEGAVLRMTSRGFFSGTEPMTLRSRWQRCDTGGDAPQGCIGIDGTQDAPEYTTTTADVGKHVRVRVTAENAAGAAISDSSTRKVDARPGPPQPDPGPQNPGPQNPGPQDPGPQDPGPQGPGPGPQPPGAAAEAAVQTAAPAVLDGTSTVPMPDVRGMDIDEAEDAILAAGVHARVEDIVRGGSAKTIKVRRSGRTVRKRVQPGEVFEQSLPAGSSVKSDATNPRRVRLAVYWSANRCSLSRIRRGIKDLDLEEAYTLLRASRCQERRLNVTMKVNDRLAEPEVKKVRKDGKDVELLVSTPEDAARHDLALWVGPSLKGKALSLERDRWSLVEDHHNAFTVQVTGRDGVRWAGARVLIDADAVGGRDEVESTDGDGFASFQIIPKKSGYVNLLAQVKDRTGKQRLIGFGRVKVERHTVDPLITAGGQVFDRRGGEYFPQQTAEGAKAKAAVVPLVIAAGATVAVIAWYVSTRRDSGQPPLSRPAPPPAEQQTAEQVNQALVAEDENRIIPCQGLFAGPATGAAPPAELERVPLTDVKPGGDLRLIDATGLTADLNQVAVCSDTGQTQGDVLFNQGLRRSGSGSYLSVPGTRIAWADLEEGRLKRIISDNGGGLTAGQAQTIARYVSTNGYDAVAAQVAGLISDKGLGLTADKSREVARLVGAIVSSGGGGVIRQNPAFLPGVLERSAGLTPDQARRAAGIISTDGAGVIATGGGNLIAPNAMSFTMLAYLSVPGVSRDAAEAIGARIEGLIGQAGGNIISTDGAGVISTGGGNLIGQAGGNLIGQAGGNLSAPHKAALERILGAVISTGGGNVISTGGGNLIGQAGGNIISTDGAGVIATGGLNFAPLAGALSLDPAKLSGLADRLAAVISTGGGNVISTGGGNLQVGLGDVMAGLGTERRP